ncbi:SDR family oxidoreductase [Chlorobium sp. N1]|uniref:SDR family oxidoreductase n=1 Tax=Chlorobium sp. N1 TaxID=2491138 RepID=UPI00103E7B2C|nr:SDR family oxidoreductase [Chlorobium sp. N1]TCD47420.1 SDR family oxidoreductase [Chlorobium sp. N1]
MATYSGTVLVIGATGRTGRAIVARLKHYGIAFRLYVRSGEKAAELFGSTVETAIQVGSIEDEAALNAAMQGCTALICAIGSNPADPSSPPPSAIDRDAVRRLARLALEAGMRRFILISSLGATHPEHPLNKYGQVLTMKLEGEDEVRRRFSTPEQAHTVIRPGGLLDAPPFRHKLIAATGDTISGSICRGDVAEIAVLSLSETVTSNATFELIQGDETPQKSLQSTFASLK